MITKRFKIFDLLGFPVYLDLSWFVAAVLIAWSLAANLFPRQVEDLTRNTYWLMGIAGAIGLFACILAHELGHAVIARRFHMPIRGITLFIFGGVAELSKEPPSAKAEFFVAIAGPIVSVVISMACFAIVAFQGTWLPDPVNAVVWYLAMINAILVIFNLIPAFPLDGGRVLRSFLWHLKNDLRWATRISSSIGSAFGTALMLFAVLSLLSDNLLGAIWQFLIGMLLKNAAQMSYQQVLIRRALEGEPVSRFMNPNVISVEPSLTVESLVDDYVYRHHHKMYPVIENDRVVGCVTTRFARLKSIASLA
jgi:Zn-dependent protease